jgi:hypothetical protein
VVQPSRFGRIFAGVALVLFSMCITAQAQVFSPTTPVSKNGNYSWNQQVAEDAAGNIYVVWEDDSFTTPYPQIILFSRSTDGGATFSPPKPLSNRSGFASNPRICVDGQGGINVVWQDNATAKLNSDVFFSRSADGGLNFSNPMNLSSANDPGDSTNPQIAADAAGNIYVVWEGDSIHLGIFLSRSTDGGASFSTPLTSLAPSSTSSLGPQIAVGADGSINVVWQGTLNVQSIISFSRSVDHGATFSNPPTNISKDSGNSSSPQIALDSSGNINVVWVDDTPGNLAIMFRRSDKSATFPTASINVSKNPASSSQGNCDRPQIGVDANGNIEVVWQQNTSTSTIIHQIFSAGSTNGGSSFSPPQNLSKTLGDATNPGLMVEATGGINLGWQDTTPGKANIFFTRSPFSTVAQNLSNDLGPSRDVQIAADKNGNLDVVWSDGSSGGVNQILFRRFTNQQKVNQPPVANAGADQTLQCAGPKGTPVTLDGSASSDSDGDALSFVWTDEANNVLGKTAIVQLTVGMGAHTFTLTVSDAGGLSAKAMTHVTVLDTVSPTLKVSLSPSYLRPPNHKLVQVTATVLVSDVCDANPTVQLVSITSTDPIDADDMQAVGGGPVPFGTDVRSFLLGAELNRDGSDRVYTVTYKAKDASGNTTVASAQVEVGKGSSSGPVKHRRKGKGKDKDDDKDEDKHKDKGDHDHD